MTVWSKEVFSRNLTHYMDLFGKNQKEIAEIVGVSAPTVNDWLKMKKYPRIDKIQTLADYFGILKSDLIEDKSKDTSWQPTITPRDLKEINNIIANARDLLHQDGLMFDGKPATDEDVESILSAMEIGLEMAKKKSKEKFTPKKYKEK
ncbi:MAG: helix-turn-helix transcriptional regulator [Firmicutes bacterium]|nr:helix-turn-helix transcriptional regulator [Bacillota bacterium]